MDIDLNQIKIETDLPVIARIKDDLYPYEGYDHIRYTARALAENEEGKFGFLHIEGEDFFGMRDHLETCGGGIEENEGICEALEREIGEEMGYGIREMQVIGCILDAYNLIGRITLSSFAHEEEILIREIVWLDPTEALKKLKNDHHSKVDLIVQRRDAMALEYYLKNYTDLIK